MQFFFADDSSQNCARNGMEKLVAFGGVLVDAVQLKPLSQRIDNIAASYGLPREEEIKWSPRKGSWIYNNLKNEERLSCYTEVLQAANDYDCKVAVALCDYAMCNLKPEWGSERCVTYALERVSLHLAKAKQEAVIIADRPSGGHKEADQFIASFLDRLNSEHNHISGETFSLNMLTAPSHMVRHLQLADLVVSITTAMFAGQAKWAGQYFDLVKSMLLKNALGYIGGTGVKVYPDQLINLYHWVLGENQFSKARAGLAWPIPSNKLRFHDNDGTQQFIEVDAA